ncbi:LysR family transcriptional regulator [Thermophilibacter sp.]
MLDYRTRTFLAVCRAGSFTRAAEELHVTQPAVSQHIRQLERHYGHALFAKTARGVRPTAAGDLLYRALDAMDNDERRLRAELDALDGEKDERPPLRLGCTRTIADHVAPRLLADHLSRRPDERVLMRAGNTRELVGLIEGGEIDFALVEGPFDRAALESAPLSREPFAAVAAPGTPRPAGLADLLGHRLVLREPGSGTREILERHLAARDLAVSDFAGVVELASIPAIKACVRAGVGVSFLYRVAVADELAAGTLADVTPPDLPIEHDFALVWQRGSHYGERYRALLRTWRSHETKTQ